MNLMEQGNFEQYKKIAIRLNILFAFCLILLLVLHIKPVTVYLIEIFGDRGQTLIKSYFFGNLGALISCSIFLARDKDFNKQIFLKDKNSIKIELPDSVDNTMYVQRVITSGILAVLGVTIMFAGLSYLDVQFTSKIDKQKYLAIILSIIIGLYQGKFLKYIDSIFNNIFKNATDKNEPQD